MYFYLMGTKTDEYCRNREKYNKKYPKNQGNVDSMNLFHSTQCYRDLDTTGMFFGIQNFKVLNTPVSAPGAACFLQGASH